MFIYMFAGEGGGGYSGLDKDQSILTTLYTQLVGCEFSVDIGSGQNYLKRIKIVSI